MVSKIPSSCLYKKQFPCQNHLLFKVFLWVFLPKDLLLSYTKETKKLHSFKQNHSYYTKKMPFLIDRSAFQIGIMQFCIDQCNFAITRKWLNLAKKIAYSQRTCKNANYYANMQPISVMLLLRYCTFCTFSRLWTGLSAKLLRLLHRFYILPYTAATIFFHKQPLFPSSSPLRR